MAKRNPAFKQVDAFTAGYKVLADKLIRHITPQLTRGVSASVAVNRAFVDLKIRRSVRNLITEFIIEAFVSGGIEAVADVSGLKKWFLDKRWPGDKLTLSGRINKLRFKSIIIQTIQSNMRAAKSWTQLANSMTAQRLQRGDIAKHITRLVGASRGVMDARGVKAYRTAVRQSQRSIDRLAQAGAPTKRLKAAYQDVVIATRAGTAKGLEKAINTAVVEKARYNASRIARTEIARAYGEAYKADLAEDEDATGTLWSLSTRHNVFDICDHNSGADMYGMGTGVYPKGTLPEYPAHPHCLCVLSPVYDIKKGKFAPKNGETYLNKLPVKKQKELLGVERQKQYRRNPKKWRNILPQYSPGTDKPAVPKKFLK